MQQIPQTHYYSFQAGDHYYLFTPENVSIYQIPPHYYEIAALWDRPEEEIVASLSNRYDTDTLQTALQKIKPLLTGNPPPPPATPHTQENPKTGTSVLPKTGLKEVHLQVSHYCNLDCKYCYAEGGSYGKEETMMTKETARQAVEFFVRHLPQGIVGDLSFDGGEPLTNWDVIQDAVEYGEKIAHQQGKKLFFFIGTNGTLLDRKKHDLIKKKGIGVGVSIDGDQATHDENRKFNNKKGSYDTIVRNIHDFIEGVGAGNLQARGTITRFNLNITETVKHLLGIGFNHIYLDPVSSTDPQWQLTAEEMDTIKEEFSRLADFYVDSLLQRKLFIIRNFYLFIKRIHLKKKLFYKCGVGRNGIAITPTGDIYPCYRFTSVPSYRMGSIFEEGIDPRFRQQFVDNHVTKRPLCSDCWAKYLCGGGCPYHSMYKQGNLSQNDPQECSFLLHMIDLSLQIYVRVKQQDPQFWNHFFRLH